MSAPLWASNDGSMDLRRDSTSEGPRLALYAPDVGEAPLQFLDRTEAQELVAAVQEWLASDCGVPPAKPALTAWEARQLAGMDASAPADSGGAPL